MSFAPKMAWAAVALLLGSTAVAGETGAVAPEKDLRQCGQSGMLGLPDGSKLKVRLVLSRADKTRGLSGFQPSELGQDEGMFFGDVSSSMRRVSMRRMHFDIDVFFLDRDLRVVDLQRGLKAPSIEANSPSVDVSKRVYARHTLEIPSDSPFAMRIESGAVLRWLSNPGMDEIERCILTSGSG